MYSHTQALSSYVWTLLSHTCTVTACTLCELHIQFCETIPNTNGDILRSETSAHSLYRRT